MKKYIVVIFILLILSISSVLYYKKNSSSSSSSSSQIDNFTQELFTITSSLLNAKCITPDLKSANEKIIQNDNLAQTLISESVMNGKSPSPSVISNYNKALQNYKDAYSKLSDCSSYCFQGDFSTGNCICPNNYPIPIQINNKIYCASEDCLNIPNAVFVPSSSPDPSTNQCNCKTGYTKEGSYCYSNSSNDTINSYFNNLQSQLSVISNSKPINVFGTYQTPQGSLYTTTQSDLPQNSSLLSTSTKLSSLSCANDCLESLSANSFSFNPLTQLCSLYSSSPSISQLSSINGTNTVGTKNKSLDVYVPPTLVPTTFPPTLSPITFPPTLAPTTFPPTLAPITFPPTLVPTTFPPTLAPTTFPPTLAPTTAPPSFFPFIKPTTSPTTTTSPTGSIMTV